MLQLRLRLPRGWTRRHGATIVVEEGRIGLMAELTKLVIAVDMEETYVARLREHFPDLEIVVCTDREALPQALAGAQAMVGWNLPAELLPHADQLRWLQTIGAGVNQILVPELINSDILITNNSGVHASNMAEHLLAMMLAFARLLPELVRHQSRREWYQARPSRGPAGHRVFELTGQTLAVVGLGDIGQALAMRASALGMRVLGLRRRPGEVPPGVEQVYLTDHLHDMLRQADHVAICLPLTHRTRRLFDPDAFAAMRPTAYLYNVGRGEIIDHDALIAALQAGRIAGAGLDVTDPEPLPVESPLWDMPNVLITCHTSGATPHYWDRAIEILLTNIARFRRDEPLVNVVDKREGY